MSNIISRALSIALVAVLATSAAVADAMREPIRPLPPAQKQDALRVQLGRDLFRDVGLSANDKVSCASCHDLSKGGADGRTHSIGFDGATTAVNAPTVLNAALNFRQFWNGRADSLEAQIAAVVENPIEMGSKWPDVVVKLARNDGYRSRFSAAYADGITRHNIIDAIASFERTLITRNSRFDRYLQGDPAALTPNEKLGYAKFKEYGCVACHQGANVGGNMFQRIGVMGDYFAQRGTRTQADLGRYLVTGREADRNVFKVPSLRNVALTAPYFHDGSATTLPDAVAVMFRFQLGRVASTQDREAIVRFLQTLTGDVQVSP